MVRPRIGNRRAKAAESVKSRLRPILLTTATTILGLLPLYLGGGPMWEPLAIAIMFGLAFSTVLTLGLVPVLYSLLFRVSAPEAPVLVPESPAR
jgi:multidrug efflux pump subunit AcrB